VVHPHRLREATGTLSHRLQRRGQGTLGALRLRRARPGRK
jgi:hypothetical protein